MQIRVTYKRNWRLRFDCEVYGSANVAVRFFQSCDGSISIDSCCQHDQSYRSPSAGGFERAAGSGRIASGCPFEDADGALRQLFILRYDIHHKIPVDITETAHCARRNHVEHHLVCGGGFHPGRSRENFGTDLGNDGEVSGAFERRFAVTGEGDCAGAAMSRKFDGGDGKWGSAARSDADDNIVLVGFAPRHFVAALPEVILANFGGGRESLRSSGNHELYRVRADVECGWALDGVESGDTAAGPRANIDQTSAMTESGGCEINGACDLRQSSSDGGGHGRVFVVDEPRYLKRGLAVEIVRRAIGLFGAQPSQIIVSLALWLQAETLSEATHPVCQ